MDWRDKNALRMYFPREQATVNALNPPRYGMREDGTRKGRGWLGEIPMLTGDIMTELSTTVDFGRGDTSLPIINPYLSEQDIGYLIAGNRPTPRMLDLAVEHARRMMATGRSPYAD